MFSAAAAEDAMASNRKRQQYVSLRNPSDINSEIIPGNPGSKAAVSAPRNPGPRLCLPLSKGGDLVGVGYPLEFILSKVEGPICRQEQSQNSLKDRAI